MFRFIRRVLAIIGFFGLFIIAALTGLKIKNMLYYHTFHEVVTSVLTKLGI